MSNDSAKVSTEITALLASLDTQANSTSSDVLKEVQDELTKEVADKAKTALLAGGRKYVELLTKLRKERAAMAKLEASITGQMDDIKTLLTKVNAGDINAIDDFTESLAAISRKLTGYVNAY